jgi:hypothetical protein
VNHPQHLPREFRIQSGFGKMATPFIIMIVFFGLIMTLLGSILTGNAIVGVGIGVVGAAALFGVLYLKFTRMRGGTVLRMSEYGCELVDSNLGFHVRLTWPSVTRIGQVDTQMANPGAVGDAGGVQVSVGAHQSEGLIGWGQRTTPPNAPAWMRANLAAAPVHPADGRPEVAITLSGFDPNWRRSAIGQWVGQYRPDLMFGGQAPGYPPQPGYPPGYPQQPGYPPR